MSPHRQPARRRPLGEILVEEGWASVSDVEQALTDQPHISQRLASLLVNRGLLDPDHAARALGRQHTVPAALLRHLAARDPAIGRGLPADVAHAYSALALAIARDGTVVVCVRDPDRPELRLALEHALGRPVTLVVACDAALLPLVREVYGPPPDDFEVDMSFDASSSDPAAERSSDASGDFDAFVSGTFTLAALDDERVVRDPSQSGAPTLRGAQAAVSTSPRAGQGRAPAPDLEQPTWLPKSAASLSPAASPSTTTAKMASLAPSSSAPPLPPSSTAPPFSPTGASPTSPPPVLAPGPLAATASAAMARAKRKEELLDATFSALTPVWAAAVLFSVKDSAALGQRGFGGLLTPHAVDTLVVPLHSPSLLRRAWQSRVLVESEGNPGGAVQERLLRLLGSPSAYAVPVEVAGRIVGLLAAAAPKDPNAPSALVALAHHLGQHFGRIIRAAKSPEAAESA